MMSARKVNWILAVLWLLLIPIAIVTGWIYLVAFVSAISLYANVASHVSAAYAADDRAVLERIDRLERTIRWQHDGTIWSGEHRDEQ